MRKLPTLIKRKPKPAPVPEVVPAPIAAPVEPEPVVEPVLEDAPVETVPEPAPAPEPEPTIVNIHAARFLDGVTIETFKPAPGDYRVVIAVVDEHGHAKSVDFTINAQTHANLTERSNWDQHFYPALLRLTQM